MDELPTIRCLPGPCGVDGSTPSLVGKPYAAFWLIALEPSGVTREDLAHLLWPDSTRSAALNSVRNALHTIRKAFGATALVEDSGSLRLAEGAVKLDLWDLDTALASGDHEGAHALWRGGPFAEFSVAGSIAFNQWADELRTRYEQRLGSGLLAGADAAVEDGRSSDILSCLSRALEVMPYQEAAHTRFVEALLEMDRLEDAEIALHNAYSMVEEPSPGTLERLRDRLHRQRRHKLIGKEGELPAVTLEFVGRSAELARLRAEWKRVCSGETKSVAILGDVGIGKSRLVEESLRTAVDPDVVKVRVRALHSDRGIEHGVTAELARQLSSCPGAAGISSASAGLLRQLVPTLGKWNGEVPAVRAPEAGLAEALRDLLEAVASEGPLVLYVDDLQWADPSSRTLLLRALRSVETIPLLTLITCRSGQANQPVIKALQSESGLGRLTFLELGPLTEPDTQEAIGNSIQVVPETATDVLVQRFFRLTQGNPLFLAELLRTLADRGIVERSEGGWCLEVERIPPELPLPQSVREILEARLSSLSEDARTLAAALAANGRRLSRNPLSDEGPLPPGRAQDALNELGRAGIVAIEASGRFVFTHDAIRESATKALVPDSSRSKNRRLGWWLLAPATVALAAVLFFMLRPTPAEPPFGEGSLWVLTDEGIAPLSLPGDGGPDWRFGPAHPVPPGLLWPLVWTGPGGALKILGGIVNDAGVPMAVEVTPDGRWRNLLAHDGDVNITDVAPDGEHVLLSVADESGPDWRMNLVRLSLASGDTAIVHHPTAGPWGFWWADGSTILSMDNVPGDSLHYLRPDGRELASYGLDPHGRAVASQTCVLPGGKVLTTFVPAGQAPEFRLISFEPPGETRIATAAPFLGGGLACSPDGKGAAYSGDVAGKERVVVQDLETGDTILAPPGIRRAIRWTPARPIPVPVGVEIEADSVTVAWGESSPLAARVRVSDGTSGDAPSIEWHSLDPRIAYISAEGTLTGNQGGITSVIATVHGWLADTVQVRVDASRMPEYSLLADPFEFLDTANWVPFGDPTFASVEMGDGPALELTGNGVGVDGLRSKEWFDLRRGATVEIEYRLPLNRRDRQQFSLCLAAPIDTARPWAGNVRPSMAENACFGQPYRELARFDSAGFALETRFPSAPLSRPDLFPADEWRHIALVVAPDGQARLLVDREEVTRAPYPLRLDPDFQWYVTIWGRSVDTHLLIRNFVLWDGMRY